MPMNFDGENIFRCPKRPYLEKQAWFDRLLMIWHWSEKGHFADEGTYMDQANSVTTLIPVINTSKNEAENAKAERERKKR